jgi:hypothetical protein
MRRRAPDPCVAGGCRHEREVVPRVCRQHAVGTKQRYMQRTMTRDAQTTTTPASEWRTQEAHIRNGFGHFVLAHTRRCKSHNSKPSTAAKCRPRNAAASATSRAAHAVSSSTQPRACMQHIQPISLIFRYLSRVMPVEVGDGQAVDLAAGHTRSSSQ